MFYVAVTYLYYDRISSNSLNIYSTFMGGVGKLILIELVYSFHNVQSRELNPLTSRVAFVAVFHHPVLWP